MCGPIVCNDTCLSVRNTPSAWRQQDARFIERHVSPQPSLIPTPTVASKTAPLLPINGHLQYVPIRPYHTGSLLNFGRDSRYTVSLYIGEHESSNRKGQCESWSLGLAKEVPLGAARMNPNAALTSVASI